MNNKVKLFIFIDNLILLVAIIAVIFFIVRMLIPPVPTVLAFPGAEGFGASTPGGRGGAVYIVTNLNDSGAGSLRQGLEIMSGPRIIVFSVSGYITLSQDISIINPYVTVAGQTAPGDGVVLRLAGIAIHTHDVIIRGMKIRVGDNLINEDPNGSDAISLAPIWGSLDPVYNVIIDHNDFAWALDENVDIWHNGDDSSSNLVYDVTFSWNFVYEALNSDALVPENTSTGALIGGNNSRLTLSHNLFASNADRNPLVTNFQDVEMVNNLIYNWGDTPTRLNSLVTINIINNFYRPGPDSSTREIKFDDSLDVENSAIFVLGNYVDVEELRGLNQTEQQFPLDDPHAVILESNLATFPMWYTDTPPIFRRDDPILGSSLIPDDVSQVYNEVLNYGGAQNRDAVSQRIISEVETRTGSIIASQLEVGGWHTISDYEVLQDTDSDGMPDIWEASHGLNPQIDDSANDYNRNGYTNIEDYINSLIVQPESHE